MDRKKLMKVASDYAATANLLHCQAESLVRALRMKPDDIHVHGVDEDGETSVFIISGEVLDRTFPGLVKARVVELVQQIGDSEEVLGENHKEMIRAFTARESAED